MSSHKGIQDGMLSLDIPPRIFINHMDSYHGKKLTAIFLGRLTSAEEKVEEEQSTHSPVNGKAEVIGTLEYYENSHDHYLNYTGARVIDTNNKKDFLRELLSCSHVIYDITRDDKQISEASWALYALSNEVESLSSHPLHFLLISPIATWSLTRQLDPENPSSPLTELDYTKRLLHRKFTAHRQLESQVLMMRNCKELREKVKTLVLCPGITYGAGEDSLHFLFKLAWHNAPYLPVIYPGNNKIPLLHVDELVRVVHSLFQNWPEDRGFLVACEFDVLTQRKIVENISKYLTTGQIKLLDGFENSIFIDAISQKDLDVMTIDINVEPALTVDHDMQQAERSFDLSIESIIEDYREERNLQPVRAILIGPPVSGKTHLAMWFAKFYHVTHISVESLIKENTHKKPDEEIRSIEKFQDNLKNMFSDQVTVNSEVPHSMPLNDLEKCWSENASNKNSDPLTDNTLNKLITAKLSSPACRNQGYIFENYPQTENQAKLLFQTILKASMSLTNSSHKKKIQPEVIVMQLEASDEYLYDRVLNLPERVIQHCTHYAIERMLERLRVYRQNSLDIMEFFAENGVHPLIVTIEGAKNEESLLCNFKEFCLETIGQARNYGPTTTVKEFAQRDVEKDARVTRGVADEERDQNMIDWSHKLEEIERLEEEKLRTLSEPLRLYLVRYIFPTLSQGLLEVARSKPENPVDYLAAYLFQQNPDGKMIEFSSEEREQRISEELSDKFSNDEFEAYNFY